MTISRLVRKLALAIAVAVAIQAGAIAQKSEASTYTRGRDC